MISDEERRYLHWLTCTQWRGRGHVVEMGPWLGGSTVCLADGMRAAGAGSTAWRLHVYDSFVWQPFMAARVPLAVVPGGSFEAAFSGYVSSYADLIRIHRAELPDEEPTAEADSAAALDAIEPVRWPSAEPIEILFVDGAKSWNGMRALLHEFGPHLTADSLVAFQDYLWWGAFWVPLAVEMLAHRFTLVHRLSYNTVTFRCDGPLDAADLARIPEWSELSADAAAADLEAIAGRFEAIGQPTAAATIRLGIARLWSRKDDPLRARSAFARAEAGFPLWGHPANLEAARGSLERRLGARLAPDFRSRLRRTIRRVPVIRRLQRVP